MATLADLDAFLAAQPKWSTSVSAFASYGYRDNLLLSFSGEERSPFVRGGVELVLLRLSPDRFEYNLIAEMEGTRYTEGKTVDHDARVWLQTEPAFRPTDTLKLALPLTGYYSDQVLDVSDTEVERLVSVFKVHGAMIGPLVRWDFLPTWWIEGQGVLQRKWYDDRANDGDVGEGNLRLGWSRWSWLELRLSGTQRWRDFDSRTQSSASGRELLGTRLKITEREFEARCDLTWDAAGQWETSTRVALRHYRDNGAGYLNYREQRIGQDVEWDAKPWLIRLGASAARVDFSVQKVGLGIDPPARVRDEFSAEFHLERKLSGRWTALGSYQWERWRSNDPVGSYTMNEGLLGLRWSWEK